MRRQESGFRYPAPKGASNFEELTASLNRLRKSILRVGVSPQRLKNKPVIAAVNGCATQNQMQHRPFSADCKAMPDTKHPRESACFHQAECQAIAMNGNGGEQRVDRDFARGLT